MHGKAVTLSLALLAPASAMAEAWDSRLAGTTFIHAGMIELQGKSRADVREAFLWRYRSALGAALQTREPSAVEIKELRRICREMRKLALSGPGGTFDDYLIEFVDGKGDPETIPPTRRSVFSFEEETGCQAKPRRAGVS